MSSEPAEFVRLDRHSANPKSSVRAPPKKRGAGGRFTFGSANDPDSQEGPTILDEGDPNYENDDYDLEDVADAEFEGRRRLEFSTLRPGLRAACRRWLPASVGHQLSSERKADFKCWNCNKGAPYVFAYCTRCDLCASCCMSNVVIHCPAMANGGPLHQHSLKYVKKSEYPCQVSGPGCPRRRVAPGRSADWALDGWVCSAGCRQFFLCECCAARPVPEYFVSSGRKQHKEAGAEAQAGAFDVHGAELRAASEWEMRENAQSEEGAFLGLGTRPPTGAPKGKGKGSAGKASADREVRPASTQVPPAPPLERHLSDESKKALRHFAVLGGANADVATAEELLAQGSVPGRLTNDQRDELRKAIGAGEVGVAAQFYMGARLASGASGSAQTAAQADDVQETCPVCAESISKSRAVGALVGCLNGHGMHAACASDLALGGAPCPACRAPLFYGNVGDAKSAHFLAKFDQETEIKRSCNFSVGDVVLVHPNVIRCKVVQELPGACGWNKDMASASGSEGVVVEVVPGPDGMQHVEVKHDRTPTGAFVWRWHSVLLVLVKADSSQKNVTPTKDDDDKAKDDPSKVGEKLVQSLREELTIFQKAREEVRAETAQALGMASSASGQAAGSEAADSNLGEPHCETSSQLNVPGPPILRRTWTHGSAQAVLDLGMTVAPVDMQRARHLLGLARQWGDSDTAKKRRAMLHNSVRAGDLDSVARMIRQYNTAARVQHALWLDADRPTSRYRVSLTARVELLARPHLASPRTSSILQPGMAFASTREVLDVEDNLWLRVGDLKSATNEYIEGELDRKAGCKVDMSDMPDSVGARVMRGPNWKNDHYDNGDADGGVGNVGTIIGFGNPSHEFIKVRWDYNGSECDYWAGPPKTLWELAYAGSRVFPPQTQGWLRVRPSGPGGPPVVSEIHGMLRCFKCGGELPEPSCALARFEQVKGSDVKSGDKALVASTMEPVIVEKVVQRSPDVDPLLHCRYDTPVVAELRYDSRGSRDDDEELIALRPVDLVRQDPAWTTASKSVEGTSDFKLYNGLIRSRREFIMMLGSLEAAKEHWSDSEDAPENYASCIRGHYFHARCFQDCLFTGSGCPVCQESLFVPGVQREGPVDEAACCGQPENDNMEVQVEPAATSDATAQTEHADIVGVLRGRDLRMCPLCYTGPLLNENCADMRAHHGQCPTCKRKPFSDDKIAEAVARAGGLQTSVQLPRCPDCNVAILFNGCRECGYLFTTKTWTDLPHWDPKAKDDLHTSQRYLRAVRLLAEQARAEAALLAHERTALNEATAGIEKVDLDFNEEPPSWSESQQEKKT